MSCVSACSSCPAPFFCPAAVRSICWGAKLRHCVSAYVVEGVPGRPEIEKPLTCWRRGVDLLGCYAASLSEYGRMSMCFRRSDSVFAGMPTEHDDPSTYVEDERLPGLAAQRIPPVTERAIRHLR
jgi:hypothetical protein